MFSHFLLFRGFSFGEKGTIFIARSKATFRARGCLFGRISVHLLILFVSVFF